MMVGYISNVSKNIGQIIFPVETTSGINKNYFEKDLMILSFPDSICRNKLRGDFVSISKAEILKIAPWPEKFSGTESLRHFKINEKWDQLFINKKALIYHDNHNQNETSGLKIVKNIKLQIRGTKKLISRYKNVWIKKSNRQYHRRWSCCYCGRLCVLRSCSALGQSKIDWDRWKRLRVSVG